MPNLHVTDRQVMHQSKRTRREPAEYGRSRATTPPPALRKKIICGRSLCHRSLFQDTGNRCRFL
jgi:hypothetical protein